MPEPTDLLTPRLRWLQARMDARYALADAHAAGQRGDALLETAAALAQQAAERMSPQDASTLLGEPWLLHETMLRQLAQRCHDELYELAAANGWLRAA